MDLDDELLAAPTFGEGASLEEQEELQVPVPPAGGLGGAEAGDEDDLDPDCVRDAARVVTLRADERGRITMVRLSPVWWQRLGNATLESCFANAFLMVDIRAQADADTVTPTLAAGNRNAEPLPIDTWEGYVEVREQWRELRREALERFHEVLSRPQPTVTGRSKGATVKLNSRGLAETVSFEEKWLNDTNAGAIAGHVQRALDAAYSRYKPPAPDDSELTELATAWWRLRATSRRLMGADDA